MHWRRNTFPKLDKYNYWWGPTSTSTNWIEPDETWEEWSAHLALFNGVSCLWMMMEEEQEGCCRQARHSKLYFWWKDNEAKGVSAPVLQTIAVLVILMVRFAPVPATILGYPPVAPWRPSTRLLCTYYSVSAPTKTVTMYFSRSTAVWKHFYYRCSARVHSYLTVQMLVLVPTMLPVAILGVLTVWWHCTTGRIAEHWSTTTGHPEFPHVVTASVFNIYGIWKRRFRVEDPHVLKTTINSNANHFQLPVVQVKLRRCTPQVYTFVKVSTVQITDENVQFESLSTPHELNTVVQVYTVVRFVVVEESLTSLIPAFGVWR